MVEYMQFPSHQDMLDWLEKQREAVNERALAAEQQEVGYGSHFVRWTGSTTIFGRVLTEEEIREGEDPDVAEQLIRRHNEGWMWTFCQSDMDEYGDYGTVHRSAMWPISERLYLYAQSVGWNEDRLAEWALLELTAAATSAARWSA